MDNAAKPVIHGREGTVVGKGGVQLSIAPCRWLFYRVAFVQPTPAAPAAWGLCVAHGPGFLHLSFVRALLFSRTAPGANQQNAAFHGNSMQMQTLRCIIAAGVHSSSQETQRKIEDKNKE